MAATDLKIIIAGCGIGGLSAAIALELAGIDYTILEESPALDSDLKSGASATNVPTKTTHVGGAIQVAPTAIHFLSQLGIYDEMKEISKPVSGLSMNEHDMNYVGRIDLSTHRERQVSPLYGYHTEVMARSQLQALLLQRVPSKRIVAGKVLGMIQNNEQVTVRCSDGKTYEGDILIAADGAFSNIRHSLYWTLDEKKQLPKADAVPMSVDLHIISGCTKPLDPAKYPVLLDAMSEIQSVQLPDKPYAIWFMPLLDNRIAWDITKEVNRTAIRQGEASKVYQWRPEDVEETLKIVRELDCPYGGQIGDLLDTTPVENMHMHMSEERFCETWSGGRTVLLGDACHKGFFHPVSEAMVDAVTLVNLLSKLQSDSMDSLTAVFKEYKERRAPTAKAVVEHSTLIRQVFTGKGRAASLKRNVVFNYMPEKVRHLLEDKRHDNRPQLWFLPQAKDKGIVRPATNLPPVPPATPISPTSLTSTTLPEGLTTLGGVTKQSSEHTQELTKTAGVMTASTTVSTSRSSRSSWTPSTRPAFSMPSAGNVPLFTSTSRASLPPSIKSPRGSTASQAVEKSHPVQRNNGADVSVSIVDSPTTIAAVAATAATAAISVDAEVAAWSTVATSKETESVVTKKQTEEDSEVEKKKDMETFDDSSDDEGEFVNCSQTLDDDIPEPETPRAIAA
ncbi:hypothetical protein BG015_011124 [Linnemannia schmuckeri]|uniref:FAD-binding domain-containing protein n=1 Tax=Linnemannia schmuckeri TaxID=64567 RepID=A0A9P5S4S1_9FUNG|nr:hypothetical protein BG015_011124 [Linnemannia schmuckeri]